MKRFLLSFALILFHLYSYGQSTYVYTKYGNAVEVFTRSDVGFNSSYSDYYFQQLFPQATLIDTSTRTYNCHYYAWYKKDGGNSNYWMNCGANNSNISNFWIDDYYGVVSSTSAIKIHYYSSDHSAVISSVSGMYDSKWGEGPLMRHAPNYGPYEKMFNRTYFAKVMFNGLLNHNGYGETFVGVTNYYSAPYIGNNVYGVWEVFNAKGEKEGYTENPSGSTNTIVFNVPSLYELYYNLYLISTNEPIGVQWYEVIVEL